MARYGIVCHKNEEIELVETIIIGGEEGLSYTLWDRELGWPLYHEDVIAMEKFADCLTHHDKTNGIQSRFTVIDIEELVERLESEEANE